MVRFPERPLHCIPSTGTVVGHGVSGLPPRLKRLYEQTEESLRHMVTTISSTPLDSVLTIKPVPSQLSAPCVGPTHDIDVFVKHGQNGVVISGTLPGLLQELIGLSASNKRRKLTRFDDILDVKVDRNYKETFLALYRMFTTGEELLRMLLERFEVVSSSQTTDRSTDVRPL